MGFRTVYGNSISENGWRMCNRDECDLVRIPDLYKTETAPLRKGPPHTILGAWLYWYDRNVEEITSSVWGWSATNDVGNSNHLSGTAVDINAPKYPWGARVMPAHLKAKVEEGLRLFEGSVYWGARWSRADEMHYQMAWREGDPRNEAFAQKLLNGYLSIYKPGPPPPPPPLSRADRYAQAIIAEGQRLGITERGIVIALAVALVETNLTMYANSNDPLSLQYPHDAVGSDHMSSGIFQQQTSWGSLADRMDATRSANIFFTVDRGFGVRGLTKIRSRDNVPYDYNDTSHSPGFYAQKVQGSAYPDRYDMRMAEAQQLYDRLVGGTVPPPIQQGDDMALVPQEQWDNFYRAYMHDVPSLSPLRALGEGPIGPVHRILRNIDSSEHVEIVALLARLGHPPTIALLRSIADADPTAYPDRQQDRLLAQAILSGQTAAPDDRAAPAPAPPAPAPAAPAPPPPAPAPPPAPPPPAAGQQQMTGRSIADAYNALVALQLNRNLPAEVAAPLAALIGILSSYPTERP